MAKVKFRTAMSVLKKGGKACYQCVPVLEKKVAENVTASVGAILYSVQQVGQASPNVIVKGGEVVVINGNFILTADGADTGVWLEKDGVIIARGVIGQSDHNTIDCTFPDGDFPEDGQYKLVIATRDGKDESFGVDRLERNVTVVNG